MKKVEFFRYLSGNYAAYMQECNSGIEILHVVDLRQQICPISIPSCCSICKYYKGKTFENYFLLCNRDFKIKLDLIKDIINE